MCQILYDYLFTFLQFLTASHKYNQVSRVTNHHLKNKIVILFGKNVGCRAHQLSQRRQKLPEFVSDLCQRQPNFQSAISKLSQNSRKVQEVVSETSEAPSSCLRIVFRLFRVSWEYLQAARLFGRGCRLF